MIRFRKIVKRAICDACGARLSTDGQENDDGTPSAVHHGELKNRFGYGSDIDTMDSVTASLDLCEECYKKCLEMLRIPLHQLMIPAYHLKIIGEHRLLKNDESFAGQKNEELYYTYGWGCRFCDWTDFDHGLRLPEHRCENVRKIDFERGAKCQTCSGPDDHYRVLPSYSEVSDSWVHYVKRPAAQEDEPVPCSASALALSLMKQDERVDPEIKAKFEALDAARKARKKGAEPIGE